MGDDAARATLLATPGRDVDTDDGGSVVDVSISDTPKTVKATKSPERVVHRFDVEASQGLCV